MKALELRAKGAKAKEVAEAAGFHAGSVTQLVAKYRDCGIDAITGSHYGGNRRNMSVEEETAILVPDILLRWQFNDRTIAKMRSPKPLKFQEFAHYHLRYLNCQIDKLLPTLPDLKGILL